MAEVWLAYDRTNGKVLYSGDDRIEAEGAILSCIAENIYEGNIFLDDADGSVGYAPIDIRLKVVEI